MSLLLCIFVADHSYNSTEVAALIPVANTGKVKLQLDGPSGPILIPVKESVVIKPGKYSVIALIGATSPSIATIIYAIGGFTVTPTSNSVRDARFAVYVNLSEP